MTYQIICHDGKKIEITNEQKENIYRLSSTQAKAMDINGEYIAFSNIARIEKVRGEDDLKLLEEPERVVYSKEQFIRALSEIIRGFKKHFGDRVLPEQSKQLLDFMENKLDEAKKSTDYKFTNPVDILKTNYFQN